MADNVTSDEPATVGDVAPWYENQVSQWEMMKTLMSGTAAMRAAGETYLPRFPGEEQEVYDRRLATATLNNFTKQMIRMMVGLIFAEPVEVTDSKIDQAILDDIDKEGRNVHSFARNMCSFFFQRGIHHILVDMPQRPEGAATAEDDVNLGMRPYWVSFRAETVFNAFAKRVNGAEQLMQVRWYDPTADLNGFEISYYDQIRVMNRSETGVRFEVWRRAAGDEERDYILHSSGDMTIKEIPLATAYNERDGFMCGKSPLEDVGYLNVEHWQSKSDQRNILTVSRYPVQYQIGTENPVVQTGPYSALHSTGRKGPDAQDVSFGYIEPVGTGIAAGERDLDRIVAEAESLGMQLLVKSPAKTATGAGIDFAEDTSPLQDIAHSVEDALNAALRFTALWLGMKAEDGGKATVNKDFGISADEAKRIDALLKARAAGDISRETFWEQMQEIGVLRANFDPDEEAVRLDKEEEANLEKMAPMTPDAGNVPPIDTSGSGDVGAPPLDQAA